MEMLQTFESTVLSDSTEHSAHFLVVPKRTFEMRDRPINAESIIPSLNLRKLRPVKPAHLVISLAVLLSDQIPEHETIERLNELASKPWEIDIDSADVAFAQKAAFERMIPLEQSPLDLESLAKLVTSATGAGLGAYAGFVLFESSPLLFVAAPFGMILFGAAKGIADALEQGLREKVLAFIKGENEPIPESPNTVSEPVEDDVSTGS